MSNNAVTARHFRFTATQLRSADIRRVNATGVGALWLTHNGCVLPSSHSSLTIQGVHAYLSSAVTSSSNEAAPRASWQEEEKGEGDGEEEEEAAAARASWQPLTVNGFGFQTAGAPHSRSLDPVAFEFAHVRALYSRIEIESLPRCSCCCSKLLLLMLLLLLLLCSAFVDFTPKVPLSRTCRFFLLTLGEPGAVVGAAGSA